MKTPFLLFLLLLSVFCLPLNALAEEAEPAAPLELLKGKDAPEITEVVKVLMTTDAGELVIEVYPQAAPNAAERFLELVEAGYYDGTPIFRVVKSPEPFVAQFGINSDMAEWKDKNFDDDPTLFQLTRGTLAFAKAGPNTNSTQVFINFRENNSLADPRYNFTTFAQVVEGMEIADSWVSVGDPGMGLSQGPLWENHHSVKELTLKPNMIEEMTIMTDEDEEEEEEESER
jgi:cyclophilin family peptidyl-prolyl cis-trans isomerase